MCRGPRAAHDAPMILNDQLARVLVEDRHREMRATPRRRWVRFTRNDSTLDRDRRHG
jgi:hypothetical protein